MSEKLDPATTKASGVISVMPRRPVLELKPSITLGDCFRESGRTRYNVGAVTVVAKIEPSCRIARFSNHVGYGVS